MGTAPVLLNTLDPMVAALREDAYRVVGPTVRDGAIVLDELETAAALPSGWGVDVGPGGYRLSRRADAAAFAHAASARSWKSYLHPPREPLWTAARDGEGGFAVREPDEDPVRYAFLGVRACDLRAIAVLDRVLSVPGGRYARRRERVFIVAVNCTEPAATCFCAATGNGPAVGAGFDVALTELADPHGARYIAEAGSDRGVALLARLPGSPASETDVREARSAVAAAAGRMGRSLPAGDLRDLLAGTRTAARWDDVGNRCLTCGNCTMVCPTCFCSTIEDDTDLAGDTAHRTQRWDSCFDIDFSYLHGGPVRPSASGRYRQWLSHKLGAWHDQFGESGCVGCGRCIVWCPAGIDITEEVNALAEEATT
ncbi:4Fe-4S dicluster domain-containing protein [Phytohabitans houttuyneae]|uniref:4Fe-4S ferredoxin n=1 Tax=Phytohabitans houttuyneae TaxID=1076126 RepID=A0A6V8KIZ3_9ACTN|nr:4Fe-4S dicluster domain-containing protein [Phytohabitans houttuyneae]GFJ81677.1 4Fe-4S ferredoxin [Phytohabitans houttuyneae]